MKKFLTAFFIAATFSSSAFATGLFVGADAIFSDSNHRVRNLSSFATTENGDKQGDDSVNFGVNAGVRFDLLNFMASGEIFYDNLQTEAKNFRLVSGSGSNLGNTKINSRYGAKVNFGSAIFPKTTTFLTYGLTNVNYDSNLISSNQSLSKDKMTPLYGAGLLVDLPFTGLSLKATYDYQRFTMKYADSSAKVRTYINVFKLGVIYNF